MLNWYGHMCVSVRRRLDTAISARTYNFELMDSYGDRELHDILERALGQFIAGLDLKKLGLPIPVWLERPLTDSYWFKRYVSNPAMPEPKPFPLPEVTHFYPSEGV